jgi:hypothetical protein
MELEVEPPYSQKPLPDLLWTSQHTIYLFNIHFHIILPSTRKIFQMVFPPPIFRKIWYAFE